MEIFKQKLRWFIGKLKKKEEIEVIHNTQKDVNQKVVLNHEEMIDLRKILVTTDVRNFGTHFDNFQTEILQGSTTEHLVYTKGIDDFGSQGEIFRHKMLAKSVADSAIADGVERNAKTGEIGTAAYKLRDNYNQKVIYSVEADGRVDYVRPADDMHLGDAPAMRIDLAGFNTLKKTYPEFGKIEPVRDNKGNVIYYTTEIGYWPLNRVKSSSMYDALLKYGQMKLTGRTFTGYMNDDLSFVQNHEYEYEGKRFVHWKVNSNKQPLGNSYNDGTLVSYRNEVWMEVMPVKYIIMNMKQVQDGTAQYLDLWSEKVIKGGIPFYYNTQDKYCTLYQNSITNAYLDSTSINGHGNAKYATPHSDISFANNDGFLNESLVFPSKFLSRTKEDLDQVECSR